jgi:hypothetical protein
MILRPPLVLVKCTGETNVPLVINIYGPVTFQFTDTDKLDQILLAIQQLNDKENVETMKISDLLAKAQEQKTVSDSVVALLGNLSQMLKDAIAANDPAQIQAVADLLDGNTKEISDAVVANTPAAPVA